MRLSATVTAHCVVGFLVLSGCPEEESGSDGDKAPTKAAGNEGGKSPSPPAKAGDEGGGGGKSAAGGAVVSASAVRECPKSLSGKETVDRVITKECGTVPVTGNYSIDGATLVVEAGATLAFKDGTELNIGYYEPAKLVVQGTKEAPVTFTTSGDKSPGVWGGVRLHGKANRSSLEGMVLEYAGGAKEGGLLIEATDVTVKSSKFVKIKNVGVTIGKKGGVAEFDGNAFDDVGKIGMRVTPGAAGQLGDNVFKGDARVHVTGGKLTESTTWGDPGAPLLVVGKVQVNGAEGTRATLTIGEGVEVMFDGDAGIEVGYYSEGGLTALARADDPVVFTANEREEPGAWGGISIYRNGEAELGYVEFLYGGKRENQGVLFVDKGRLKLEHARFVANKVGLVVKGKDAEVLAFDNNEFEKTQTAMDIPPAVLGALGSSNTYDDAAVIAVRSGKVEADAVWQPQGAKVELRGTVQINKSTVEVKPGYAFHVKDAAAVEVGYYDNAALKLMGTAAKPITFVGLRDDPGSWKSITFYRNAHGNVVEHVQLRNAGGKGGVVFDRGSDGKVDTLTCEKCSGAVLERHEKSNVEATGVK